MAISGGTAFSRQKSSSLDELIAYLRAATGKLKENNLLIIPLDTVNGFLGSFDRLDETGFPELVALFDGENKGNCSRLDLVSFHCMLHILLRAPPCLARDRGLYLFLKSMRALTDGIQRSQHYTVVAASRQRKSLIGQKTFNHLLSTFASGDAHAPRKWSGQFILELARKSKDNSGLLALVAEGNIRKLGGIVLSETDYILRFLAGVIIQEIAASQREPHIFWPPDTPQPVVDRFSSGTLIDSDWIRRFNCFVSGQDLLQNIETQRMHIVQTINAGASSISNSNCSMGILVSHTLTVMITEDNRFRFMKIRLDHIDKFILREKTAVLEVCLNGNGFCMTNGLIEKVDVVSMTFENQTQAIEAREAFEQQHRSVKGVNGGPGDTYSSSTIMKFGPHGQKSTSTDPFSCRTGAGRDSTTLEFNTGRPTAQNVRRKPSYAAIMFSFEEGIVNGSSAHLDLSSSDNPNERDRDTPDTRGERQVNNYDCSGSVESEYWGSYPSRVDETPEPGHPFGSCSRSQERNPSPQKAANIVNPSKTQDVSCNGETQPESGAVEPHISQEGSGCPFELPSLARQALQPQPQPQDSNPLADVPGQEGQVEVSSLDLRGLVVEKRPLTADNPAVDPEQPTDTRVKDSTAKHNNPSPVNYPKNMGHQINVPVKDTSKQQNEADIPNKTGNNSKLKRPHHRISESKTNQLTVDWDQDLRVEDTPADRPASFSKRQKKTPPQPKGPTKITKTKSASRSTGKKNKKQEQALPLTPHIAQTSAKGKTKKAGRQVTKTLTSARQRRAAAERANQKLVLANEYENATYDLDDPIESSPLEELVSTSNRGDWTASTDVITPVVSPGDVEDQPLRSVEGLVNAITNPPALEVSELIDCPEITRSEQVIGNEENVSPVILYLQQDTSHNLNLWGTNLLASEQSPSAHPAGVDNAESPFNVGIAHQKTTVECKENNLGRRLSEALAKAGILSSNSMIASNNLNGVGTECQVRKGGSEISKNVSQFIARQALVGQRSSIDEHGKLDHSKAQPTKIEGVPVKAVKPNVETDQSAPGDFVDQQEEHPIMPAGQCQLTTSPSLRSTLKPDNNGQDKSKDGNSDIYPETAVELRKVQVVGFDSNGPRNQCTMSGGPASRYSKKVGLVTNETHTNGHTQSREDRLREEINGMDDMDEVSLVPTSECLGLGVVNENGDTLSLVHSSSVREVTEAEFRSQGRAVQPIPVHSQTVDENGSPQPFRRDLGANGPAANTPSDIEPHINISGTSQTPGVSASFSGEELDNGHRISVCSDSEITHVDHIVGGLAVNSEISHDPSPYLPRQRREASSKQKDSDIGNSANQDRSNLTGNSFWRRSAPSTFAERLRGQKRTQQKTKMKSTKVAHKRKRSVMTKNISKKPHVMPFVESSSELEQEMGRSEAEAYNAGSSCWDTAGGPHGSSSNLSDTLVEEYRDVESEWQNALRATQKTSLDILLDTSGRLIRHLLDEEQAIAKVVNTYRNGGARLIKQLEQRYDEELEDYKNRLQPIKEELIERCEVMVARLNRDRQSFSKLPTIQELSAAVHKRKRLLGQVDSAANEYETDT